jgi:Peptidase family M1 domain
MLARLKRRMISWLGSGLALAALAAAPVMADAIQQTKGNWQDKFRQLEVDLPTPHTYRTASGAPGHHYWQQRADYKIEATLDAEAKRISGKQTVRYANNAPDTLTYLWLQLDQNIYRRDSLAERSRAAHPDDQGDRLSYHALAREKALNDRPYGMEILRLVDAEGKPLSYTIVDTMMRIDLPRPLAPNASFEFSIDFAHNIIEQERIGGRSGYEHFEENNTDLFFLAQFFPRLAAYADYAGWQHKAFLGRGEFTLEFGNYDVSITVPANHIVSATGELHNPDAVLTGSQRQRLAQARDAKAPVFIVTPQEALANEKTSTKQTRTWQFKAKNVRDFAFASSSKFIWDAIGHRQQDANQPLVMAMSFYPNEAEPLWSLYSTRAIAHTLQVYSKFSFPYPYPTAQSVNTWERGGMEYPMITFNGFRPVEDKKTKKRTYTAQAKYGTIGVIIHEVGHIYFPMIVNSDERQWSWMDEGINTFLQNVAHLEWEENFNDHTANPNLPARIAEYMASHDQVPIMTQSDSIVRFHANSYAKPAAALTILRETVMGRELFDRAFREYAQRWKFKRPTPADFFRTMEDASGIDLDWFWRGWFYTTDHVDVALSDVREYRVGTSNPEIEKPLAREESKRMRAEPLAQIHNRADRIRPLIDRDPAARDFYNENDRFTVTNKDRNTYKETLEGLEPWERRTLERAAKDGDYVYFLDFKNEGGLVTPLPLELSYEDGSKEFLMIPAEIWRFDAAKVTKPLIRAKRIVAVRYDPREETADADRADNDFPRRIVASRLQLYKAKQEEKNLMADMLTELRSQQQDKGAPAEGKTVPLAPGQPQP